MQVSSVELERACAEGVPAVQEVAAVGVPSPGGGPEQLVLFVVPRGQPGSSAEMKALCQDAIRSRLNPLFKVEKVSATVVQPPAQGSRALSLLAKRGSSGSTNV